jgi:hypothetical protein
LTHTGLRCSYRSGLRSAFHGPPSAAAWAGDAAEIGEHLAGGVHGQVTVAAAVSRVKSSRVKPPATAGRAGQGLITAWCPASAIAWRSSPVPYAASPYQANRPPPPLAASAATNCAAAAASEFWLPAALVSFSSVMIPVPGSAATWAR